MFKFTVELERGDDPQTGLPCFGFEHDNMFITDPFVSECGRFSVDPMQTYHVSEEEARALVDLNKALTAATQDALNAGCAAVQAALGVTTGDVASGYFSGGKELRQAALVFAAYAEHELALARARAEDEEEGETR